MKALRLNQPDKKNLSSDKLLRVIETMAQHKHPISLPDLAILADMNISTTRRFLTTLLTANYVTKDEHGNYYLTMKIYSIASHVNLVSNLKEICTPHLRYLSKVTTQTVNLGLYYSGNVIFLDSIEPKDQFIKLSHSLGTAPLYCTAIGKLFLLNYSDEELEQYCKDTPLTKRTSHTISTFEELKTEVLLTRELEYAYDNQEYELEARCIAAPIKDYSGKIIAGISLSGLFSHLSDEVIAEKLDILLSTCREISIIYGAE